MSISSRMIEAIAEWRNPLGKEENWLRDANRSTHFPSYTTLALSEAGFMGAATVAVVESLAYMTLHSIASYRNASFAKNFFSNTLRSSTFSIKWSLALASGYNFRFANLLTKEDSARHCDHSTGMATPEQRGVAQDEMAADWFRKAAEQGNAADQLSLGALYAAGLGVAKDEELAAHWFLKAAEQGDASAQFNLGVRYATGLGVAKDEELAAHWFLKAAEQGHASAQFNLGVFYGNGRGVAKDQEKAAHWFLKAAGQGHLRSQKLLDGRYLSGFGVVANPAQSCYWLRQAAEQGDAESQYSLAQRYRRGIDGVVNRDLRQAAHWCIKAATQGYAAAYRELADVYRNGWGVSKDEQMAEHYLELWLKGSRD